MYLIFALLSQEILNLERIRADGPHSLFHPVDGLEDAAYCSVLRLWQTCGKCVLAQLLISAGSLDIGVFSEPFVDHDCETWSLLPPHLASRCSYLCKMSKRNGCPFSLHLMIVMINSSKSLWRVKKSQGTKSY